MRLITNLLIVCMVALFLFAGCAGLMVGGKAVTSAGNHTEINVFSGNFNDNNLWSRNTRTDTRTSNIKIDNDNTVGVLALVAVAMVGAWIIGRMLKVG